MPDKLKVGSSPPRATSICERAVPSSNCDATTVGFRTAASAAAFSEVVGRPVGRGGRISFNAAMPMTCWNVAREVSSVPSAWIRLAVAPASRASACATSVRVTSPTRN